MPIKEYKPTTPSRRSMQVLVGETTVRRSQPERSLVRPLKKTGGRNNMGRITMRHRGGGHKRRYRVIDFRRDKFGVPAVVKSIEYDPNRSANIALLQYADGEKRYILAPRGLNVGDQVLSGEEGVPIRPGNAMPLEKMPLGTLVHNVELEPGRGGQLVRSAGTWAQILAKEGKFCHLRLPSGEVRLVLARCMATVGQVGNVDHANVRLGKAGRSRWLGRRPKVRGVAMNPNDHPHGGGEGKAPIGRKSPVTPWGKPTLGRRTRKKRKSNAMIIRNRRGEQV